MAVKDLEVCHVTPSPEAAAAAEHILPLLHFDVAWLPFPPTQILYFHDFHHSESHFLDTIVPNLKKSLSLTLKHFLPLAGKIVFPLSSALPFSHYTPGEDSVPLTVSVSASDFSRLTVNQPKGAAEFHDLVPELPPPEYSSDSIKFSITAIRITLFPTQGVCIGFNYHHSIADAHSFVGPSGFVHAWSTINSLNGDQHLRREKILPSYDRRSIVEGGRSLTASYWSHVGLCPPLVRWPLPPPACNLRGTFVLSEVEIGCLKKFLRTRTPPVGRISSYVALTAHVWSCLAEAAAASGEEVDEDEAEYFSVSVDCRGRLTPPLPETYFGNCLVFVLAETTHGLLKGREGFPAAARAIAAAIERTLDGERGVLANAEAEYLRRREVAGKRLIGVSGSHRLDVSGVDYGWGKIRKFEVLHINYNGAMSLIKSKQGIEVGLSMPKPKMDAFASIFKKNLYFNSNL